MDSAPDEDEDDAGLFSDRSAPSTSSRRGETSHGARPRTSLININSSRRRRPSVWALMEEMDALEVDAGPKVSKSKKKKESDRSQIYALDEEEEEVEVEYD